MGYGVAGFLSAFYASWFRVPNDTAARRHTCARVIIYVPQRAR
jgi:hypothetical protein